jgi:Zn-dependent protease
VEQTKGADESTARPQATLPPEVEAELRRRLGAAEPLAPPAAQPAAVEAQEAPAEESSSPSRLRDWLARLGPIGVLLLFLIGKGKYVALVAKFGLPALKTGGTMLVSIVVYAQIFGWRFAVGFVLSILVHELGHVFVAWRLGIPVSAPLFIPGFGAFILQKERAKSAWEEALIGIGGPVGGTLAGLFCLGLYQLTGSSLMLALAYTGFVINLFNMAPIFPLDGGWITGAVSPRLWLLGIVGLIGMYAGGLLHNPLILLLIILSIPRLWHGLTTGDVTPRDGVPTTPQQRLTMGLSYVALCGLLAWLAAQSYVPPGAARI